MKKLLRSCRRGEEEEVEEGWAGRRGLGWAGARVGWASRRCLR